jgi:glycosyltransferase involved in cell wall biosynthesis
MNNKITVFIGLYNAEKDLPEILNQLVYQTTQNFGILVVDNNSVDNSYKLVNQWKSIFKGRINLIRNKTNLGAYGSLFHNIEYINTTWFTWWHQDDLYKENHIETLNELISKSNRNIAGVSTTMGSMAADGKALNSYARPTWFAKNTSQIGQFIQNIKAQSIPDPATAFRVDVFKKTLIPVHSSSFPDTEHTLLMLHHGKFLISQKETMLYRENPYGISKIINQQERDFGAAVGLTRVFHSDSFRNILLLVSKKHQNKFAERVIEAIEMRFIGNHDFKQFVSIVFLERLILEWGYDNVKVSKIMQQKYSYFASKLTLDTISNLGQIPNTGGAKQGVNSQNIRITNKIWHKYSTLNLPFLRRHNKLLVKSTYKVLFIFRRKHRLKDRWD